MALVIHGMNWVLQQDNFYLNQWVTWMCRCVSTYSQLQWCALSSSMLLALLAFLAATYWCEDTVTDESHKFHHQVFCILLFQSCCLVLHVSFGLVKLYWVRTTLLLEVVRCVVFQSTKVHTVFQEVNLPPLWGTRVGSPTHLSELDRAFSICWTRDWYHLCLIGPAE
jgi:hypothetical protein